MIGKALCAIGLHKWVSASYFCDRCDKWITPGHWAFWRDWF